MLERREAELLWIGGQLPHAFNARSGASLNSPIALKEYYSRQISQSPGVNDAECSAQFIANMKTYKILISFILPLLLCGCLGVYQRYLKNMHPYNVGEYLRKIDNEHYEWIIINNNQPLNILVFRYYSANEWFLKDNRLRARK